MALAKTWRIAVITTATSLVLGATDPAVHIGNAEQLFLDDHVIARSEGITRRVNRARKHPVPVIVPDKIWERNVAVLFGTVLFDAEETLYKAWYHAGGHVGYAVSKDGLNWVKPEMDIVLYDDKKTNLVVERGKFGHFFELFGVLKDPNDPDPKRRYKMAFVTLDRDFKGRYKHQFHSGQRRGLGTAVSPDGVHWELENNVASTDVCDISRFYRDPESGEYILFGRTKITPARDDGTWKVCGWGRAVHYLESTDFRTWTPGELVLAADAKDPDGAEIYSVSPFLYEGVTIGLVQMFYGLPDQLNLDLQLGIARDGKRLARVEPRDPFIAEGPVGSWDRYNISAGCVPPVPVGDELWFYYSGRTCRHSPYKGPDNGPKIGRIGLAKIKRGRFLSLEASFESGTILTKPLVVEGNVLYLNANTAYGTIDVSLQDVTGKEISKRTTRGKDGIAIHANFRARALEALKGKSVRLHITIRNAQLYGFRIK